MSYLAYAYFIDGQLEKAIHYCYKALELNPNAYLFMGGIGWILAQAGQWEQGLELIRKSIESSPSYPRWFHMATCLHHIHLGDFAGAAAETQYFSDIDLFIFPLFKAFSLGLAGKKEEAGKELEKLLELKPDFPKRARHLIGMYVKFADLKKKVVEGLKVAGLDVEG